MIGGEESLHLSATAEASSAREVFAGNAVEFAAIAGGNDDGLFENSLAAQLGRGFDGLLRGKRNALAQLDRSGAMVAADQSDMDATRLAYGARRIGDRRHIRSSR